MGGFYECLNGQMSSVNDFSRTGVFSLAHLDLQQVVIVSPLPLKPGWKNFLFG